MDPVSQAIVEVLQSNKPAVLATVVKVRGASPRNPGAKMVVYPDGSIVGSVGGGEMEMRVISAAQEVLRDGQTRYLDMNLSNDQRGDPLICGGEMEIFVEPLLTALTLVIVGAGHIGAAASELGKFLGFRTVVLDDRPDFVTSDRLPYADERRGGDFVEQIRQLDITPQTYVVIVTRAHTLDAPVLRALVNRPAAYIGMLGSKRRVLTVLDMLKKEGVSEEALARVHAPIGLEIHAETPQEIAVSIMGEIIAARRQGK
ncbi:MAG: XdhC/CoxI family protein [Chloroflexi bacterium]|nr:XdhC/CoxI family protein [Chloroflexota bacterium]